MLRLLDGNTCCTCELMLRLNTAHPRAVHLRSAYRAFQVKDSLMGTVIHFLEGFIGVGGYLAIYVVPRF